MKNLRLNYCTFGDFASNGELESKLLIFRNIPFPDIPYSPKPTKTELLSPNGKCLVYNPQFESFRSKYFISDQKITKHRSYSLKSGISRLTCSNSSVYPPPLLNGTFSFFIQFPVLHTNFMIWIKYAWFWGLDQNLSFVTMRNKYLDLRHCTQYHGPNFSQFLV